MIKNLAYAEKDDQAQDNFFRAFKNSPVAMTITRHADGKFLAINQMYTRIMGYQPKNILGSTVGDLDIYVNPKERALLVQKLQEQGVIHGYELLVKIKTGEIKTLLVSMDHTVYDNEAAIISTFSDLTERKHIEAALRKSEERFRSIFQNHSAVKLLIDPDTGNIVQANDTAAQFYGFSCAELMTMRIQDINTLTPEQVKAEMAEARSLHRTYFEFQHRLSDGSVRDVEVYSSKVEVSGKELLHSIVHDITKRKQAETQLKKSHDLLSRLARLVPGVIYQYRLYPDGRSTFPYASPGMNDIYEVTPEQVKEDATPVYGRLHPDDYDHVVDTIQKSADTLETFYCEFRVVLPRQGLRWRWSQAHPERMPDGSILWHGIISDITERKQAEEEIAHFHDLMQYIIEHNNSAVSVHDHELRYVYVSQRYLNDYGLKDKNIIGRHHYEVFPDLPQKWRDVHQKALAGQVSSADRDAYIREDGKQVWTRWECRPWYQANGKIGGIIIYTEVITDRIKAEERIQQSQKMEAIGTLAGGIAHDFNNILFPVIGHADMLLDDIPKDSPFRNSLDQIHTGALRARELVHQILAFSRQEKNELARMKIQPIVKEVLKLIRSTIPTTIAIKQYLPSECGPVKADPVQIHQIIMNLATNAYHAMAENGGTLTVSLKEIRVETPDPGSPDLQPGLYACLSVADTGTGMDKETVEKIFDPFFTTKKKGKGTGIGLSVVHDIVKTMNGAIQVQTEPGRGTAFHLFLPVVGNGAAKNEPLIKEPLVGGTEHILLVDDEKPVIAIEKQLLSRLGYQVTSCTGSNEALEMFTADPDRFDMVITDIAMPKMSGDKLANEMLTIRPDIPILLCTGFSETMTDEKMAAAGVKGLLMKPFVITDLDKKLREIFGQVTGV